jgi:hypothetical protein
VKGVPDWFRGNDWNEAAKGTGRPLKLNIKQRGQKTNTILNITAATRTSITVIRNNTDN